MINMLKYFRRRSMYQFLIDDFGMTKVFEKYNSKLFGNRHIKLSSDNFYLNYILDKSIWNILIESKFDEGNLMPLCFIMDYLNKLQHVDTMIISENMLNVKQLNEFIKKNFQTISYLYSELNYKVTKKEIHTMIMNR